MIRAGELDRLIDLQANTPAQDEVGQPIDSWATVYDRVPAAKRDATRGEVFTGGGEMSKATVSFRIRWIDGVDETWRVLYEGKTYEVLGALEIGRREGVDIMCRALGQAGVT